MIWHGEVQIRSEQYHIENRYIGRQTAMCELMLLCAAEREGKADVLILQLATKAGNVSLAFAHIFRVLPAADRAFWSLVSYIRDVNKEPYLAQKIQRGPQSKAPSSPVEGLRELAFSSIQGAGADAVKGV